MRVWRGVHLRRPRIRAVAALGMFDGVHRGHQRLMATAVHLARELDGSSVAVTFDPDPQRILHPRYASPPLLSLDGRLAIMRELGIDAAWVLPFSRPFSQLSAEAFVRDVLIKRLVARAVVVGDAFRFGHGRAGDVALLRRICEPAGIRVVAVSAVRLGGAIVSSSRIRALIRDGNVREAARLLGRPHQLTGRVVRGRHRGTAIGFPTANVRLDDVLLPAVGVYRVWCRLGAQWRVGLMNLGHRPTFGGGPVVCEVHLVGWPHRALYGRRIQIALYDRVRAERTFSSSAALAAQIRRDVRTTTAMRRPPARVPALV